MAASATPNKARVAEPTELARRDFRREVTDRIIDMLETGVAPWQKPWDPADASLDMPMNPTTAKAYRGGNAIHVMATSLLRGYGDPRWMTYRQAAVLGWQVRKGEKGTQIEFWEAKPATDTIAEAIRAGDGDGNQPAGEPDERCGNRLIHRVYTVFNAKQIENIPERTPNERTVFEVIEAAEQILTNSGATILHDQADRSFYNRLADRIHLPPKHAFQDAAGYYGTALHELAHWSGHPSRLDRATLNESYRFGDISYAKEELRAELASVFLAAERGIPHDPEQHAAYVSSWINVLKQDKNEIFRAAHEASRAADLLLALSATGRLPTNCSRRGWSEDLNLHSLRVPRKAGLKGACCTARILGDLADDFHCGEPAGRTQVRGKKEMTRMHSEMMKRVVRSIEGGMDSKPSAFEFEMAYQARVAIDRVKFAIRQAEQFRLDSKEQHELGLQLLDALAA